MIITFGIQPYRRQIHPKFIGASDQLDPAPTAEEGPEASGHPPIGGCRRRPAERARPQHPGRRFRLARIWSAIVTDEIRPKDQAAEWALSRLPPRHRAILQRAEAGYLSESVEGWRELMPEVHAYSEHVISEIKAAAVT
jgi:hypothetical protein